MMNLIGRKWSGYQERTTKLLLTGLPKKQWSEESRYLFAAYVTAPLFGVIVNAAQPKKVKDFQRKDIDMSTGASDHPLVKLVEWLPPELRKKISREVLACVIQKRDAFG